MTIFEEIPTLSPIQFFALSWECPYLKGKLRKSTDSRLPSTDELLDEESFAKLYMGWNEQKLSLFVEVDGRTEADSVELFFDTRDLKNKAHVSKFCHHFVFSPDESHGREVTRFRNDDIHRLCDPEDLAMEVESKETSYAMSIEIPAHCLYGYEPLSFQRMGFTYRINRAQAAPQHFAVTSDEFAIEQNPSLWATLKLMGKS